MAVQYETYETYDTMEKTYDTMETVEPALDSKGTSIILKAIKAQDKTLVLPRRLYCLLSGILTAIVLNLILTALIVVTGIAAKDNLVSTTTANSSATPPQPVLSNSACINYKTLDSADRNVATLEDDSVCSGGNSGCCDQTGSGTISPDWKGNGWYRFMGDAGTKMPDSPVGERRCGSDITSWIAGGHPSFKDFQKEVTRTIHFEWEGKVSWKSLEAKVMHCGDFYVYNLKDISKCNSVYCGQ